MNKKYIIIYLSIEAQAGAQDILGDILALQQQCEIKGGIPGEATYTKIHS